MNRASGAMVQGLSHAVPVPVRGGAAIIAAGAGKWRAFPVADAAVFTILIDQTRVPRTCLRQAGAPVCGGSDGYRNPVRGCSGGIKISSADAKCFQLGTDIVQGFGKQGRC